MRLLRNCTVCLGLTVGLVSLGSAGPPPDQAPNDIVKPRPATLVPRALEAALQLSPEQLEKIRTIEAEFKQRRQGMLMMTGLKMKGLFNRLDENNPREAMPVLTIANEVTGVLFKMRQTRIEFEKKVMTVLNDEQRARYAAWLERSPREKRAERKAKRFERNEIRQPLPDLDKELQLTPEQQRKLAALEYEWQQRFRKLLTEEQRRRYDELMNGIPKGGAEPK